MQLGMCVDNYGQYKSWQKPMQKWLVSMETRVNSQTTLHQRTDVQEQRQVFEKARTLLEEMATVREDMDQLNQAGAKMINIGRVSHLRFVLA